MRRIAIILGCPTTRGLVDLPGARSDIGIHHQHLVSAEGGAWTDEEVWRVEGPTASDLRTVLSLVNGHEFAYVAFSGHGSQPSGRSHDDGILYLADGSGVRVRDIYPRAGRALVVVDACRELTDDEELEKFAKRSFLEGLDERAGLNYRAKCRALYDALVLARGDGEAVLATACSAGQAAGETPHGGSFTRALVGAAMRDREHAPGHLSILQAVASAESHLSSVRRSPQMPEYFPGRSRHHFPFAVWPK